ncbi:MAG: DNA polymerase III subunit delta [Candidatus Moraniibacteriota bacterium]
MIQFLSGESEYFVRRRERELRADFSAHHQGAQVLILDFDLSGEEENTWRVLQEAWQTGLFSEEKMIVIRNVLSNELFSGRICTALESHPELFSDASIHILFSEAGKLRKKNELQVLLSKKAEPVVLNEKPLPQELEQYASKLFAERNAMATLSLPALRALILECGTNMYRLESEIAKLAFLKSEGNISEGELREFISFAPGGTVFEALDLIVSGRRDGAIQLFARELGKGEDAFRILGSCAWQMRLLVSVRDAYDRGIRQSQAIANQTGMKEYSVRKCLSAIAKLPMDRLKKSFAFLAEADARIKTGALRPDLAVYLFVAKF